MSEKETERIREFLDKHKVKYEIMEHDPTPTSELAAKIRGTRLEEGAKAMVMRSKGKFLMCVISGDRKIDLEVMRQVVRSKSLSFATPGEVFEVTGCKVGSVPPFGNLFGIPVYIDRSLFRNENIAFNAGLSTVSIVIGLMIGAEDYLRIVKPIVGDFST